MHNKKTHAVFVNELRDKNIACKPLEQYINSHTNILFECGVCGYIWSVRPSNILSGKGCPSCAKKKLANEFKMGTKEFVSRLNNCNHEMDVLGEYVNYSTKIKVKCRKHQIVWQARPSSLLKGCGCKECMKEKIALKNGHTHEEFLSIVECNFPHIEILSKYENAKSTVKCRCKIHNRIFERTADLLVTKRGQCPICTMSEGEKKVAEFLDKSGIEFMSEYKFRDEPEIQNKRFDFYLPELNTCIEYDGAQHFIPMRDMGGESYFDYMCRNDTVKNEYCARKGIRLIRIPYTTKEIDEFLRKELYHSKHEVEL